LDLVCFAGWIWEKNYFFSWAWGNRKKKKKKFEVSKSGFEAAVATYENEAIKG